MNGVSVDQDMLRETTLVEVANFCPWCDGDVETLHSETQNGDTVTTKTCIDCGEAWLVGWYDERVEYVHESATLSDSTSKGEV